MAILETASQHTNSHLEKYTAISHAMQLAKAHGLEFVELDSKTINHGLLEKEHFAQYLALQALPIVRTSESIVVATANLSEDNVEKIQAFFGVNTQLFVTTTADILTVLASARYVKDYTHQITYGLYEANPLLSAKHTFNLSEKILIILAMLLVLTALVFQHITALLWLNIFLTGGVILIRLYKFFLCTIGIQVPLSLSSAEKKSIDQAKTELPYYTVLVPLFHEKKNTLNTLINGLKALDYPKHKLDIKLLLEQEDTQTAQLIQEIGLPDYIYITVVPEGQPHTKPRACNYGLALAVGEYLTIFDAEDKPEPDELKVAFKTFMDGQDDLVCVQCRLNHYNTHENILTRLFTLEYIFWFDLLLPALGKLHMPIPLGGTSNHFKTSFLKEVKGWDPFNVTEDADLGIRIHRLGYQVGVANATTYEEANCNIFSWIRQRSRWIKGYMQTYLVHMRQPITLFKQIGFNSFLSFQLFVGGQIFASLANLILWLIFVLTLCLPAYYTQNLFSHFLVEIGWANLVIGNILVLGANIMAAFRRGKYFLFWVVPLTPFYYLLMSISAYIALYELLVRPSYWYKTPHGNSKSMVDQL